MIQNETGNIINQSNYELAKEPIFVDRSADPQPEISWEIQDGSEDEATPNPENDNIKEDDGLINESKEEQAEDPESQSDEEAETEELEKKKKKNRTSEKNRITQLTKEKRAAQSVAHDVLARNQFLESKIKQIEKENNNTRENLLTSQKERVKKYLSEAIEEGDADKIADANDLLGQYNAEILISKQKQNINPESDIQSYHKQVYQEPVNPTYEDTGNEWLEQNTWANPKSSNFDQEMYEVADTYSIKLEKKYKLEGRGDEIGSADFFDEITDYIKRSYDIPSDGEVVAPVPKAPSKNRIQMKTDKSPPVGSVSRQGQQIQSPIKSKDMVLTASEKEIAYSLRGYVCDPKTGQKVTDNKTLEEIYKRNLMRGNG